MCCDRKAWVFRMNHEISMRSRIKKILFWKPSLPVIGVFTVAGLLLLLLPLLWLAVYSVPWYDDFNYGMFAQSAMWNTPGILGALKGAWECARVQWYAWQGTFSSIFFMTLTPVIWGEQYYAIGPVFLILILTVSVFLLMGTLAEKVLCVDRVSALGLQAIAASMVIELIHTSQAGFYWYNAGVHYVGMHSFCMLFVVFLVRLSCLEKMKSIKGILLVAASMIFALLAGGSNFVTTLQGLLVLCSLAAVLFFADKKKVLRLLPALAVYVFAFYRNVAAPGNSVRARSYVGWGYPPLQAVWHSFLEAFKHLWEFTGWMTIAYMVLLAPIIWGIVRRSKFSFRLPGLLLAWSFCLYAAGFTPSLYSLGHAGLGRTLNAVKITYQILLLINEVYFIGWFRDVLAKRDKLPAWNGCPWWFYGLVGLWMCAVLHWAPNQAGCYSTYGAYYYIHTGEAYHFHSEYLERVEILRSDEKNPVFEPYHYRPWMLCVGDLGENPDTEENRAVASWYDKDSVAVQ